MNFPSKFAKMIFAVIMGIFGIFHFIYAGNMTGMIPSFLPMPIVWVYLTGAALVLYCVSILMGHKLQRTAGYLLALFLLLCVILYHVPKMSTDPGAIYAILKDLALAMAAIYIANDSPAS